MTFSDERKTLIRYFLGELPPKEQEQVEERYMLDQVYAELRDEVEMNLVDAYVERTLTAEQSEHFETRFMITAERREAVEAAYLLSLYYKRLAASDGEPLPVATAQKSWRRLTFPRALAAGVAIVLLGSMLAWIAMHRHIATAEKAMVSPASPQHVPPAPQQAERPSPAQGAERRREAMARGVPGAKGAKETERERVKSIVKSTPPEISSQSPKNAPATPSLPLAPRVAIAHVDTRRVDDSLTESQSNSIHAEVYRQLIATFDAAGMAAATTAESSYTVSVQITAIRILEAENQMVIHFTLNDSKTGAVIREGDVTGEAHGPGQPGNLSGPGAIGGIRGGHLGSVPPLIRATSDACAKLAAVVKEQIKPK